MDDRYDVATGVYPENVWILQYDTPGKLKFL